MRMRRTHYCDLVPDDFDFGSSEVLERDDACETRAVDHVSRVGQDVDGQSDVPDLSQFVRTSDA